MQSNSEETTAPLTGLQSGHPTGLPTLSQAREAGERGMMLALQKAERESPEWMNTALNFLRCYAVREPRFTGFMVVAMAKLDKAFPLPKNDKSWGAVFKRAIKEKIIVASGDFMPHPRRHAQRVTVWASLIHAGRAAA